MTLAIGHFAFGAAMTALTVAALVPTMRYHRTAVVAGGVWAMVPDVYHVLPVGTTALRHVHNSVTANIFWGHGVLDVLDPGDSKAVSALLLGFFFAATVVTEFRVDRVRARTEFPPSPSLVPDGFADAPTFERSWFDQSMLGRSAKRAAALTALIAGAGLQSLLFYRPEYVGLLVGLGALLELVGLTMFLDVEPFERWATSLLSPAARRVGKGLVTLAAVAVAAGLLGPVQQLTPLALSYAAIAVLLVLQTIRLWELAA